MKENIQKTTIALSLAALFSGCSIVRNTPSPPSVETLTSPLDFNFVEPRRKNISNKKSMHLSNLSNNALDGAHYYSANGTLCKNLSKHSNLVACLNKKQWQEAAPIIAAVNP